MCSNSHESGFPPVNMELFHGCNLNGQNLNVLNCGAKYTVWSSNSGRTGKWNWVKANKDCEGRAMTSSGVLTSGTCFQVGALWDPVHLRSCEGGTAPELPSSPSQLDIPPGVCRCAVQLPASKARHSVLRKKKPK